LTSSIHSPTRLLVENRAWSNAILQRDPLHFKRLADAQKPAFLWIGCSDSRVPAETITNAAPGDLFVLRNIANPLGTGSNTSSALEYALCILQVKHVVICGHHNCGGVRAALLPANANAPQVNERIAPLRRLAETHRDELEACESLDQKVSCLAELNVHAQLAVLRESDALKRAPRRPSLHGWIYGLHDGLLHELAAE
jgi:carbonic anhydrase